MASLKEAYVHVEQTENFSFLLTCYDEEQIPLPLPLMEKLLFQWHESSYYGTFLEDVDSAILLTPWMAVELLGKSSFNSFCTIHLTEETDSLMEAASTIYEFIEDGDFLPDYEAWKNGALRWKDKDGVLEGFQLEWFSYAVEDYVAFIPSLHEKWETVRNRQLHLLEFKSLFLDEQDFLESIGWYEDETPFTVGLRLNEPEFDGDEWKLEQFLRDKKNGDLRFFTGLNKLKKSWQKHADKIAREQDRFAHVVPWLSFDSGTSQLTEQEAWLFLSEYSETLVNMGVEILLPSWWQIVKESSMMLKAKVSSSPRGESFVGMNALMDFNWQFATGGVELTEEEFNELVAGNRRLVNIRGQWVKIDPEFIKQMKKLMERAEIEGLHMSDVLARELSEQDEENLVGNADELLDSSAFASIQFELSNSLRKMIQKLKNNENLPSYPVPEGFNGKLRPYQEHGVNWLLFLRESGFGACLADDMGLGKTIQMITYLLHVKEKGQSAPALIICPTSVLGNWQRELETFAPDLKVKLHYGGNRPKEEDFASHYAETDVVLTTYGLSHSDFDELEGVRWSTICLDEAQNIKNAHTKQSRAIRKLVGEHHIALSGTPMENRLTELWSIFDFMNKGYLGSLGAFHKRYVLPIEKDRDEQRIDKLQQIIKPFLLRRTKQDEEVALNLPEKLEQKEYIPLSVEQASLYEQLVKDTFDHMVSLAGMQKKALILSMLGKLKQICDHPALYLKEQSELLNGRSEKFTKLIELAGAINEQDESCLIFTQYIQMGEMMKSILEKSFGVPVKFLNGSLSKTERDQLVQQFQNKEFPFLILSLKAGGTGLNLTAANHVIHYDRWWNPAVENQATDRAYRIGQSRFVHVHKLITTGTIEEKIDGMLEKKQSLNNQIIQSENWITELSTNELEELFTLGSK
ncbi:MULTISPECIES: DEAD/DEAH box helicase [Bacillus]|uniref:ATP-dependent helicase n=2 Tax=Bacillus TaxID=1386 RepID=A0A0M3RA68_9BACI|nr:MULTISPECIES: DEAD/DEAH box helicase [Bacillus]ALC82662.1 ATP-dependent helicase [Bacillus gobiensis]MBP1081610.1 SNF2 family DNA or RNA helicase [Bacillus capparidis]MED1096269.1 DEAD/DEAH box helicase [Bacillus capparidis]